MLEQASKMCHCILQATLPVIAATQPWISALESDRIYMKLLIMQSYETIFWFALRELQPLSGIKSFMFGGDEMWKSEILGGEERGGWRRSAGGAEAVRGHPGRPRLHRAACQGSYSMIHSQSLFIFLIWIHVWDNKRHANVMILWDSHHINSKIPVRNFDMHVEDIDISCITFITLYQTLIP